MFVYGFYSFKSKAMQYAVKDLDDYLYYLLWLIVFICKWQPGVFELARALRVQALSAS